MENLSSIPCDMEMFFFCIKNQQTFWQMFHNYDMHCLCALYCVFKNVPTLASCSVNKHRWIFILFWHTASAYFQRYLYPTFV